MASRAGWRGWTRVRTAASISILPDSSSSTACARTRCTSKAATRAPIRTASRKRWNMPGEMTMSWVMLLALGAFHGINPGMGWLFAVALGMQERRRSAVIRALLPLAAGHALAVAAAVAAAMAVGAMLPLGGLHWGVAAVLVSLGAMRFVRHKHPR